mgnify:FL=1
MKKNITIIDYGAGNILSVYRAFEHCGAKVNIVSKKSEIQSASFIVLPGDGSFSYASRKLKKLDFFHGLQSHVKKGNPLLGICCGMQFLLKSSEEFGNCKGLSVIDGKVIKIKKEKNERCKIPIIGWNKIKFIENKDKTLNKFKNVSDKKNFYFIHSYKAVPKNKKDILGYYEYGKQKINAIIGRNNVIGCQFHPEKSGQNGINLIKKFLLL